MKEKDGRKGIDGKDGASADVSAVICATKIQSLSNSLLKDGVGIGGDDSDSGGGRGGSGSGGGGIVEVLSSVAEVTSDYCSVRRNSSDQYRNGVRLNETIFI